MPRKPKESAQTIIEEESKAKGDTDAEEGKPAETPAPDAKETPKPRGRPKGSKNGAKGKGSKLPPMPEELTAMVAVMPLMLADEASKQLAGVSLKYTPESIKACQEAFKAWLASIDFDLTPGWALVAAYTAAIVVAVPAAMGEAAALSEAKRTEPRAVTPAPVPAAPAS